VRANTLTLDRLYEVVRLFFNMQVCASRPSLPPSLPPSLLPSFVHPEPPSLLPSLPPSLPSLQVDMPWTLLRSLDYDDELEFEVRKGGREGGRAG